MAQFIFLYLARQAGMEDRFIVDSMAVSGEEEGHEIYPPAQRVLRAHGIPFEPHRARSLSRDAIDYFDKIICADSANLRILERRYQDDEDWDACALHYPEPTAQFSLMMQWAGEERDVSDPWYTRDFEQAYRDIHAACSGIIDYYRRH